MFDDPILASRVRDALPIFTALAMLLLALIVVGILYYGEEVFVPLALAILLSFILAPLVRTLQRARLPRSAAVATVVLLAFATIFALGSILAGQVAQLAEDLPRYQSTMREKIQSLRGAATAAGPLGRAADILQELEKELGRPYTDQGRTAPATPLRPGIGSSPGEEPAQPPVAVVVREPPAGPLRTIGRLIAPVLQPLATTGLTVIFLIFILMQREDLRNRFIRLAGAHDLRKTTAALDDAADRLSRLLLTQLALNAGFGLVIGLGLWAIGVPSPALWGILAGVLRFVPYIGAIIGAAFPLTLAVAVDPGWSMLVWTALLFVVVEPIVGHVLEPLLYGHTTGLSPVAVLLAATFWTLLWGPIGLVLAAPLTVCLVVLGRHTERLGFIELLLGDQPALSPPQMFYQRMLAGDPTEAAAQAEEFLKEQPLATYYDEVALEGLRLAHEDLGRGALDSERQAAIRASVKELVGELASEDDGASASTWLGSRDRDAAATLEQAGPDWVDTGRVLAPEDLRLEWRSECPVLCIAGRDLLDEGAALMLGQLVSKHGLKARTLGPEALTSENLPRLDSAGIALVCLSFMDAPSTVHIRYAVRRVRRQFREAQILVGVWRDRDPATLEPLRRQTGADHFVISLRDALAAAIEAATARCQDEPASRSGDKPVALAASGQ